MNIFEGLIPHVSQLSAAITKGFASVVCELKYLRQDVRDAAEPVDLDQTLRRVAATFPIGTTDLFSVQPGRVATVEFLTADVQTFTIQTQGGVLLFNPAFGVSTVMFMVHPGEVCQIIATTAVNLSLMVRERLQETNAPTRFQQGIDHSDIITNDGMHETDRDIVAGKVPAHA